VRGKDLRLESLQTQKGSFILDGTRSVASLGQLSLTTYNLDADSFDFDAMHYTVTALTPIVSVSIPFVLFLIGFGFV